MSPFSSQFSSKRDWLEHVSETVALLELRVIGFDVAVVESRLD